jgi:2,4-dienoyl-CoA reductase-like NADH-dependent reductase (Old Yellow Enzyme family)
MTLTLASPLELPSGQRLANRLVKSAMAEGLSDRSGDPSPAIIRLYERWGRSGAGLLITGNVHIDRRYRERATSMAIDGDSDLNGFRRMATVAKAEGAQVWMQLNHPGRQCPQGTPVGPSEGRPVLRGSGYARPRALDVADLRDVIAAFARSASLALESGFDGLQIHAAHGYLLSSFLSARVNARCDDYGGSLRARARLLLEVLSAVRPLIGTDRTLAVKLNASDFETGGFDETDAMLVAQWCVEAGAQCIEISGGSYRRLVMAGETVRQRTSAATVPYFTDFASRLAAHVTVPVAATGGIRNASAIAAALQGGVALIGMARPFCVDPESPRSLLTNTVSDLECLASPPLPWLKLLGPHSPSRRIRRYYAFASQAWYSEQIVRLAEGKGPDPAMSGRAALNFIARRDREAGRRGRDALGIG